MTRTPVRLLILTFAILPAVASLSSSAVADENGTLCTGPGLGRFYCPVPDGDGYLYIYDFSDRFTRNEKPITGGTAEKKYEFVLTFGCAVANPNRPPEEVVCVEAREWCVGRGLAGVHEVIWAREVWPVAGEWHVVADRCVAGDGPGVDREVLEAVGEEARLRLPRLVPVVQPRGVVVVNLPVVVSVVDPGVQRLVVDRPVRGVLVASPRFVWTFDDGSVAEGAGRVFDGVDPRVAPEHYVSHTYRMAQADGWVRLTVHWEAVFTTGGITYPIDPIDVTTTIHYPVHQARAVLVTTP